MCNTSCTVCVYLHNVLFPVTVSLLMKYNSSESVQSAVAITFYMYILLTMTDNS